VFCALAQVCLDRAAALLVYPAAPSAISVEPRNDLDNMTAQVSMLVRRGTRKSSYMYEFQRDWQLFLLGIMADTSDTVTAPSLHHPCLLTLKFNHSWGHKLSSELLTATSCIIVMC
jgi:hypothetical protein